MNNAPSGGLTPESWARLELLLDQALAVPDQARAAFLAAACGDDTALRREVETLLHAHACTDGPLERLVAGLGSRAPDEPDGSGWTGRRVGPYTVVREIGRGGMGTVYLARRADGQYDRDVALKVIQSPLDDHQRARFVAERQILARLSHPGIAQLFDGGLTDEGLPYFTMEHVEGVRIDRYCDDHELDIRSRLQVFGHVCDAVAAAHRSLVVHRDLKPSNILTTADGRIKLVDFGIAKPLDPALAMDLTRTGTELFTPDYASPEQVSGAPITTASDVYSLGAVLYQLLTGLKAHRFTSKTPADVERTICERETPSPSTAIGALMAGSWPGPDNIPPDADDIARVRRTRPDRLKRRLAGDLDTIVMKALHKDPARRYASVDLLQQDITSHLRGLPVAARPDSWTYRSRKFVTRHRASVVAGVLIVASLTTGLVATTIETRRAREQQAIAAVERDRARAEAARVKRVSGLITGLYRQADPSQSQGESITAREILDRGAQRVEAELAADPETQAALLDTIGQVYRNLALHDPSDRLLQRALALRTAKFGPNSLEVAESLHNLALLEFDRNKYAAAEARFREALALRRARGGGPGELAATLEQLGATLSETGKHTDAEPLLREALALRRQSGPDTPETMATMDSLALALHRKGDFKQAETLFRDAVEQGRRLPGSVTPARVSSTLNLALLVHRYDRDARAAEPIYREALGLARSLYANDHPDLANCMSEFARGLRDLGKLTEAEALSREALAMWRRLYGDRHRETMISAQSLAGLLAEREQVKEAQALYREALATGRSLYGEKHPLVLGSKNAFASFLEARQRFSEALTLRESELAGAIAQYGDSHAVTARALMGLGRNALATGRVAEAEPLLRRSLAVRQKLHPAGHWRIAEASAALGQCLLRARRFEEAETLLRQAYDGLRASKDAGPQETRAVLNNLVALYESWGRPGEAARYRGQSSDLLRAHR
jgi:serine/threonine protein kinase/tetratricopeptide (TPR) repeat protein